jgi:16S rRNA (guanine527-N7)-methyltransferase
VTTALKLQELTGTSTLGLEVSTAQAELMLAYLLAVLRENEQINVTSIRDVQQALTQHLLDSLTVAAWWQAQRQSSPPQFILDLGTGGGFPAAPLAVFWPTSQVLAIDGTGKKIGVVKRCVQLVGISNLEAQQVRGNDLPGIRPELRGKFNLLTARAVGPAAELLQELLPLTAPGGFMALMKGPTLTPEEERAAARFARAKGLVQLEPWTVTVPELGARQILGYRR